MNVYDICNTPDPIYPITSFRERVGFRGILTTYILLNRQKFNVFIISLWIILFDRKNLHDLAEDTHSYMFGMSIHMEKGYIFSKYLCWYTHGIKLTIVNLQIHMMNCLHMTEQEEKEYTKIYK